MFIKISTSKDSRRVWKEKITANRLIIIVYYRGYNCGMLLDFKLESNMGARFDRGTKFGRL